MVRIGKGLNLSTFRAVSDKLKAGILYNTIERLIIIIIGNLGGNADLLPSLLP